MAGVLLKSLQRIKFKSKIIWASFKDDLTFNHTGIQSFKKSIVCLKIWGSSINRNLYVQIFILQTFSPIFLNNKKRVILFLEIRGVHQFIIRCLKP